MNRLAVSMKLLGIVFLFSTIIAYASEKQQTYGHWTVGSYKSNNTAFAYATTRSKTEGTLGIICATNIESCFPYLVNGLSCKENEIYPALVSIDNKGVEAIKMRCVHMAKNKDLYSLPQVHLNYIISSNKYGIAYGTTKGEFRAAYFDLDGSAKALLAAKKIIEEARRLMNKRIKKIKPGYREGFL